MSTLIMQWKNFMPTFTSLNNRRGQGLVEYALILVLLVAIVIAAMEVWKDSPGSAFSKVVSTLNSN